MKGEITTLVISSINRLTGSTAENAKYGVNWETLLEKGEYKMSWNYIEAETDTSVPNPPTNLIATTTGSTTASIAFTPPAGTILDYTMISIPATTAIVGLSSPITFTGLTPNTAYTFTMTARNTFGNSVASAPSNSITTAETSGFTSFGFLTLTDPNYGGGNIGGQSIATSSSGVYIAICANSAIYNSSNSGASFVLTTIVKGFHTVEMNSTGQYQVALSTGIPASNIYVSSDFGVSWIDRKLLTTNNGGRWAESIAITTTGQYMFMGGGGGSGLQAQFSIDFGATWTQKGSISNRRGSTVNNTTTRALCTETFGNNINQLTLNAPPNNESVLAGSITTGALRITSDGGNNIVYNNTATQVAVSIDDGVSFTVKASPQTTFLFMRGARLWGHDASTVVYSDNLGTTWTTLLTGLSIRTMTPVVGNAKIYLVYTTGEVLKYVL